MAAFPGVKHARNGWNDIRGFDILLKNHVITESDNNQPDRRKVQNMHSIHVVAMPTATARSFQNGGADANGQLPERQLSDGEGVPCRHCLQIVAKDEPYLILAYRPFPEPQPYAETGPIFLHAEPCEHYAETATLPPIVVKCKEMLIRGYSEQNRIVYGTGQVVPTSQIVTTAAELLRGPDVAYIHVRSASNNCYQCRIDSV